MGSNSYEYMKNYYKTHPKQYEEHKQKCFLNSKRYKVNHLEKVSEWNNKAKKKCRNKIRLKIFELLGNKCAYCGFADPRALQIDHVNGGGTNEIKVLGQNRYAYYVHILSEIKDGSKDYQLLCANCNWIKRWENGEYSEGNPSSFIRNL